MIKISYHFYVNYLFFILPFKLRFIRCLYYNEIKLINFQLLNKENYYVIHFTYHRFHHLKFLNNLLFLQYISTKSIYYNI